MKENFAKVSHDLIFVLIATASIVSPLFFLPTTFEFFEYNKFSALLVIVIVGFLIWSLRMILDKKAIFTRTPIDIPILILLVVFFIASFASIDQFVSFFGAHGRIWPSFLGFATIAALYFLTISNLKSRKHVVGIIWVLIGATALASIVGIISYFGLYFPFDFAQLRSFNTVGVINRLAVLEAFVIPISATWAVFDKSKTARIVATAATLLMTFSIILINFWPAFIGLGAGLLFIAVGTLRTKLDRTQQGSLAVLVVFAALFLVIRYVPQVAQGTLYAWIAKKDSTLSENQQIDTPKEKTLGMKPAWDVAAQAIGKRPLFGTGPGTYQFLYGQLKPRYVNGTEDWAIRFDKSNSEFTEIVATMGVSGVLAYLLFLIAVFRYIWALISKSQHSLSYLPLAGAIFGYMISNFFTVSSLATSAVFFLGIALISTLAKVHDESYVYEVTVELAALKNRLSWLPFSPTQDPILKTEVGEKGTKSQVLPAIFAIIALILSGLTLFYQYTAYRGDYFYRQSNLAARANDGNKTVTLLQKALQTNPRIDTYHRVLSQTSLNAAINLSRRGNISDNERQILGQLAQVAIDQGKVASGYQILPLRLPGISSANVANWETLSQAYQALIGSVQGADTHAVNTLAQAVALDPQNPILHNQLGLLYQRLGNLDLAQRKFEDAVIVKGDYGAGHYSLANILIEKKAEVPRIVQELAAAKQYLPAEDPAISDIDKNLEIYNKQLKEIQDKAVQNQEQPQASPSPNASPSPSPSPLPSPSPSASASPSPSPSF